MQWYQERTSKLESLVMDQKRKLDSVEDPDPDNKLKVVFQSQLPITLTHRSWTQGVGWRPGSGGGKSFHRKGSISALDKPLLPPAPHSVRPSPWAIRTLAPVETRSIEQGKGVEDEIEALLRSSPAQPDQALEPPPFDISTRFASRSGCGGGSGRRGGIEGLCRARPGPGSRTSSGRTRCWRLTSAPSGRARTAASATSTPSPTTWNPSRSSRRPGSPRFTPQGLASTASVMPPLRDADVLSWQAADNCRWEPAESAHLQCPRLPHSAESVPGEHRCQSLLNLAKEPLRM